MMNTPLWKVVRPTFMFSALLWATEPQASAQVGDYNYTTNNGTITITGYTGAGDAVTIPSEIDGLPVTSIGEWAFAHRSNLISVLIPDSVTSIGFLAFYDCYSLTSVTIPNSVTNVGESAFFLCTGLTNVAIPNSVTSIEASTFSGCSSLTNVTIPNSVTTIGDWAFEYCTSLTSITIANSVTTIGDGAFGYCTSLTNVTIPDSVTNLGPGSPTLHFHQHRSPEVNVRLILKGGGCENVGAQYSLPQESIKASRDLDGCRKAILDAVLQAQGKGCGPGILGVCIGGDRATGYEFSKQQLLRKLDDQNPNPELAKLEADIVDTSNKLGIGPMGFGGATTLLGTKIGVLNRVPASYFVSVSYMCWAYRRQGITLNADGQIQQWLY